MSRTALDGFVIGDVEKDYLLNLIRKTSSIYFVDVFGFCIMGNHFHLLIQMNQETEYSDDEIRKRYKIYCGNKFKADLTEGQIPYFRRRWSDLSEYVKDIKQTFSRFYNGRNNRKGFFWSERFKSIIVEKGERNTD
jgi:REP element-mobilizing transposase RayT